MTESSAGMIAGFVFFVGLAFQFFEACLNHKGDIATGAFVGAFTSLAIAVSLIPSKKG